jgi:hypothetical protein
MARTYQLRTGALCLALAAASLGACGGDSTSSADLPSIGGSTATEDGSKATSTTVNPEEAAQEFVACLREQGLEVADPEVGSDGQIDFRSIFESANLGPGSEEGRAAMDACGDKLQNAGFGPSEEEGEQRQEALLAFTSCLRGEGLTVADPDLTGPGGFRPGAPPDGVGAGASGSVGDPAGTSGANGGLGAASGTVGNAGVGGPGGAPGEPPSEEERTERLAQMLDLDPTDSAVTAAFEACSDHLADMGGPGGPGAPGAASTTTTTG